MAQLLDGTLVADHFAALIRQGVQALGATPRLATILATDSPPSKSYVSYIKKGAHKVGIEVVSFSATTLPELLTLIQELNTAPSIDAIFVAYPTGFSLEDKLIMEAVHPLKDAEGGHSQNMGYLVKYMKTHPHLQEKCIVPCTPKAVVKLLEFYQIPLKGQFITLVNNSLVVGKPLNLMLNNLDATVVNCHLYTPQDTMKELVKKADIVITAVPDPTFVINDVKEGAVVVDVSFEGNLDYGAVAAQAAWITPKGKGGVGPVTRAMIYMNTLYAARYWNGRL